MDGVTVGQEIVFLIVLGYSAALFAVCLVMIWQELRKDLRRKNKPKDRAKLYIDQIAGDGARCNAFVIYDDRGEKLPGVRRASVHHDYDNAATIDLNLVVDGRNIVFGKPPLPPEWPEITGDPPPPDWRARKSA